MWMVDGDTYLFATVFEYEDIFYVIVAGKLVVAGLPEVDNFYDIVEWECT